MKHPIDIDAMCIQIATATGMGLHQTALFLLDAYSDLWKIHAASNGTERKDAE